MNKPRIMRQLILADFRERTRRYSFLITLGVTLFLGYLVFTGKFTLRLGDYCGIQNSAWTGTTMTMTCTLILVMFGFYLVKNAVRLDRLTGVGEILAATPMNKFLYVLGKFISNAAILSFMTLILALSAVIMQAIWGVEGGFDLWALLSPFVFVTLPAIVFVAGLAVLFESNRWLRGGIGNVVYFFASMMTMPLAEELNSTLFDVWGIKLFEDSLRAALLAAFPDVKVNFILNPEYIPDLIRFPYYGVDWTMAVIGPRFIWIGMALAAIVPAALLLNRFDPSREPRRKTKPKIIRAIEDRLDSHVDERSGVSIDLDSIGRRFSFVRMLVFEIWLMLKGYPWIWYLIAGGLWIAQIAAPMSIVRGYILPVAWIWPLLIWSSMGTRENRFSTDQLVFSVPRPLTRQLPAVWLSGILITVLTGSGAGFRGLIAGDSAFLFAWTVGVLFIPTLALTLGCLSGSSKLFEIVYMVIWYVGPLNHMPALDFFGATEAGLSQGVPTVFLIITFALIPVAILARRKRLII